MTLHTVSARAAAVLVALIAGASSYEHISSVAIGAGERTWVGYALPLAIDGLILVGVAALLEDRAAGRRQRRSAWLAVLVGVIATLAANVASADPTWTARLVAVAAPVSFMLSVEVLTRTGRPVAPGQRPPSDSPESDGGAGVPSGTPARRRAGAGKRTAAEKVIAARKRHPAATKVELAKRAKVSLRTAARYDPGQAPAEPNHREHTSTPEMTDVPAA